MTEHDQAVSTEMIVAHGILLPLDPTTSDLAELRFWIAYALYTDERVGLPASWREDLPDLAWVTQHDGGLWVHLFSAAGDRVALFGVTGVTGVTAHVDFPRGVPRYDPLVAFARMVAAAWATMPNPRGSASL